MKISGTLSAGERLSGSLAPQLRIESKLSVPTSAALDIYDGDVTVTPSNVVQTLETADKFLKSNITINPIPSNYGLITWNGSTLTVS